METVFGTPKRQKMSGKKGESAMLKRMRDIVVATVNEALDHLEDPKAMIKQYLRDVESEIGKAKDAIIRHQVMAERFERQAEEAFQLAARRKMQAEQALDAGEEDLARKALSEMKHWEARADQYRKDADKTAEQVRELKEQLGRLEKKYQELRDKKNALIARANAAKAKKRIHTTLHRIDSESAIKGFERMEERIVQMEIQANAYAGDGPGSARLAYADEVEKELEKMRARRSGSVPADGGELSGS
jgi:lia operon protein LiaH